MMQDSHKTIGAIDFQLLAPSEIRKMSATKVITADTYDDDGFPIDMGLMDPHLGVIEPGLRCKTCGQRVGDCPGHFGHIDLAMPIIHVGYAKKMRDILRCTCRACGRYLMSQDQIDRHRERYRILLEENKDPSEFVKEMRKLGRKTDVCPHCGEEQKKVKYDKPTTFREEGHKLTQMDVREWLERTINEDLELLGIDGNACRPEWMVLTVLPVPPVTARPSITLESGERSEDDLTHKLVDVLRINQRLQENRDAGAPQLIVEDLWELLQYHITTYFDNQTSGIPPARHRSGRPLKTLSQRLKGKEGRFRSNLSGKRVNFSARTVISPDPYISINEVGVPIDAATELTIPLRVTLFNIDEARALVERGPDVHPGVNYVLRPDGRRLKLTNLNKEEVAKGLEPGFVVERHLMDGDIVLFNRQPSLHRMSMMAHEVRVMPGKTFRLNLSVCPPYNADFDGDEMNLHVLQSEEARAEARILMRVQEHILSPRFGGPIIGALHDQITGAFELTHMERRFSAREVHEMLARIEWPGDTLPDPAGTGDDGRPYWTGKQVFSLILPDDLNLTFRSEICPHSDCQPWTPEAEAKRRAGEDVEPGAEGGPCEVDGFVRIRDGQLLCGTIDEKGIGAFKGEILNAAIRSEGPDGGRRFVDAATKLCIGAIMVTGFTTGIDDEDIPTAAVNEIDDMLQDSQERVEDLVRSYNEGELEPHPGRSLAETLELEIMQELGRARDQAGKIAEAHLGLDNSSVVMAVSGARGSMLNLTQMSACVGQQAVRGERISRGYQGRTLPHFLPGDLGSEAKGFVRSSYKRGLDPTEYFFHSMGGREGLVDTAVRTSRSGYMQRRLINALEDLKVEYDGTVRNTAGTIIQFKYGEDGVDPTRSFRGKSAKVDDIVGDVLDIEMGPTETRAEESTYDREDVELVRSAQDEMSEEDFEDLGGGD